MTSRVTRGKRRESLSNNAVISSEDIEDKTENHKEENKEAMDVASDDEETSSENNQGQINTPKSAEKQRSPGENPYEYKVNEIVL